MTIKEATEVALSCIEDWHGQFTGDDDEHYGDIRQCKCDMGIAYRALSRKLKRVGKK